ncbi:MAG: hypothetical protein M1823_002272 [Watsoniomyces obsoletus]|nr:MAG: hypothetical protein M1823_002272 [Watsoniomyces obsoletus]
MGGEDEVVVDAEGTRPRVREKCGRVVCAFCSPHRITIPKQFVVRPPDLRRARAWSEAAAFSTSGGEEGEGRDERVSFYDDEHAPVIVSAEGIPRDPELSGGEEVRMCNPCVPDPNNEPPPQRGGDQEEEVDEGGTGRSSRASMSRRNRDIYVIDQLDENSGARVERVGPVYMSGGDNSTPFNTQFQRQTSSPANPHHPQLVHRPSHPHSHRHAVSEGGAHFPRSNYHPPRSTVPPPIPPRSGLRTTQPTTLPVIPAEEIPSSSTEIQEEETNEGQSSEDSERDYCPICGRRMSRIIVLPSPNADAAAQQRAREEHIMDCISEYSSPRRRIQNQQSSSSNPPQQSNAESSSSSSLPSAAGGGGGGTNNGRSRADTTGGSGIYDHHRSGMGTGRRRNTAMRRMLVYQATEKDCYHPLSSSSSNVNNPSTTEGDRTEAGRTEGDHTESESTESNNKEKNSVSKQPEHTENDTLEDKGGVECLICLEEFEPGVLLARLECLCKFHERCLKAWWIAKSNNSPPSVRNNGGYGDGEGEGEGVCPVHYQSLF